MAAATVIDDSWQISCYALEQLYPMTRHGTTLEVNDMTPVRQNDMTRTIRSVERTYYSEMRDALIRIQLKLEHSCNVHRHTNQWQHYHYIRLAEQMADNLIQQQDVREKLGKPHWLNLPVGMQLHRHYMCGLCMNVQLIERHQDFTQMCNKCKEICIVPIEEFFVQSQTFIATSKKSRLWHQVQCPNCVCVQWVAKVFRSTPSLTAQVHKVICNRCGQEGTFTATTTEPTSWL